MNWGKNEVGFEFENRVAKRGVDEGDVCASRVSKQSWLFSLDSCRNEVAIVLGSYGPKGFRCRRRLWLVFRDLGSTKDEAEDSSALAHRRPNS